MPIFGPPTPPFGDDDVYIDQSTAILYDVTSTIPEHLLPRIWHGPKKGKGGSVTDLPPVQSSVDEVVQENNNLKKSSSSSLSSSKTTRRDEPIFAPRSLFDRPSPALAKLRRDYKIQKLSKTASRFPGALSVTSTQPLPKTLGPGAISFPIQVPKISQLAPTDILEWTVPEDHALLQAMTTILELPPNLLIVNLAQTPNWDFATEVVNSVSRIHRSQKQCKMRYEQVILPREEGKYVEQVTLPKKKKAKTFIKLSPPPPPPKGRRLKTSEIVANDNNTQYKNMFRQKFATMMSIPKARKDISPPVSSPTTNHHTTRSPKQNAVFAEYNINYDSPVSVPVIASLKFDRLVSERAKQLANQRSQQAELVVAAARLAAAASRVSQSSMQQVQLVGSSQPQEHLVQTHGVMVGVTKSSVPASTSISSGVQATPTLIGTLSQPAGVLLPPQPTQTLTPRAALIPVSRAPIQIHQTPSLQTKPANMTHQASGQALILSSQQQQQQPHSTIVSSSGTASNSGFPIVIPVSSTSNMVRGLIHQPNQTLTHTTTTMAPAQRFIITHRDVHPSQQIQVQHSPAVRSQQPILLTSTPGPSTLPAPILVSSCGITPSSGILIPNQPTATICPRNQTFIHTGTGTKQLQQQQIQINPQPKQVFITQQGDSREMITVQQPGQPHTALNPNPPSSPSSSLTQQKLASLVADSLSSSSANIITIPNKPQPSQGQPFQNVVRATLVPGTQFQTMKIGQRPLAPNQEVPQGEIIVGPTASTSPTLMGAVKAVPVLPSSVSGTEGTLAVPEYTRPLTVGNNIVVQLAGVPPGTKLTLSQIQQLRQSILQQSPKAFVNMLTSTSPQQTRPDSPVQQQQLKKIHIVPTTQPNLLGTSTSPTHIAISGWTTPVSTAVTIPAKYSTAIRQPLITPAGLLTEYQKAQPYGLVSTMSLTRNTSQPARLGTVHQTHPLPSHSVPYRRSPTMVNAPAKENTIHVTTRPLVGSPNVRTQLFTPVSQISLVRGTVPLSSNPITVTTIPVTYSATKTSLLRQPVPPVGVETTLRTQLIQRHQIISTQMSPTSSPVSQSGPTILVAKVPDPPQLIVNSPTVSTSGVYTIYTTTVTTTAGTTTSSTASTTDNPASGQTE